MKKHSIALFLASTLMSLTACGGNNKAPQVPEGYKASTMDQVKKDFKEKEDNPYTSFSYTVTAASDKKTGTAKLTDEWPSDIPLDRGAVIIASEDYFDEWGDTKVYKNDTTGNYWLDSGIMMQDLNSYFLMTYYYLKVMGIETIINITWNK